MSIPALRQRSTHNSAWASQSCDCHHEHQHKQLAYDDMKSAKSMSPDPDPQSCLLLQAYVAGDLYFYRILNFWNIQKTVVCLKGIFHAIYVLAYHCHMSVPDWLSSVECLENILLCKQQYLLSFAISMTFLKFSNVTHENRICSAMKCSVVIIISGFLARQTSGIVPSKFWRCMVSANVKHKAIRQCLFCQCQCLTWSRNSWRYSVFCSCFLFLMQTVFKHQHLAKIYTYMIFVFSGAQPVGDWCQAARCNTENPGSHRNPGTVSRQGVE